MEFFTADIIDYFIKKNIVLVFNNVLSNEILVEKRLIYTHTGGGEHPGKSLCKDKYRSDL